MIKNLLNINANSEQVDRAALVLRLVAGGFMITHGYPKLMKIINGDFGFADPIGLGEPLSLILTVFSEVICSLLIVIGFKTRLASIPLIVTMIVAALVVHGSDPLGDKEMAILYLAMYLAIFLLGSGKYSVDKLLSK